MVLQGPCPGSGPGPDPDRGPGHSPDPGSGVGPGLGKLMNQIKKKISLEHFFINSNVLYFHLRTPKSLKFDLNIRFLMPKSPL